jgi:hypothetical protein
MKGTRHEARGAKGVVVAVILAVASCGAWAKIPPPPPPDEKAKAAAEDKKAKDAVAADKAKADQAAAEDKAVKNFQTNMKQRGKAIPKPTPIVAAAATPAPGAKPGDAKPAAAKAADTKPGDAGKK